MKAKLDDRIPKILQQVDLLDMVRHHAGNEARHQSGTFTFHCPHPSHEDRSPSFTVKGGKWKCWSACGAGGDVIDLVSWLNDIPKAEAIDQLAKPLGLGRKLQQNGSNVIATYDYHAADGTLVYQIRRTRTKKFPVRRPDGRGGWIDKLGDTPKVLYRLPEVAKAVANGEPVYVAEGEKDADRLRQEGVVATTAPFGAAARWEPTYTQALTGAAELVVVADRDKPGYAHAWKVYDALVGKVGMVTVVEPVAGNDATDHLDAGFGVADFDGVEERNAPSTDPAGDAGAEEQIPEPRHLEFVTAAQLAYEIDNAAPVGWLCRPVWPADAYGVAAAEHKAGKTWALLDLVVSVASGTPWLGVYEVERPGPVLVFLGEGGRRKMLRRLRAVCRSRGLLFEDLPITLCFRSPHLGQDEHLEEIRAQLASTPPSLMALDPLYLAARGAKSSSLYDMGAHLENVQIIAQTAKAALVVVHHFNQTGTGRGAERMSGAGPAEWGRVLVSVNVEARSTHPETKATSVTLSWSFVGDEIPDTELRTRRRVWADNPDDLASPLNYEIEVLDARAPTTSTGGSHSPATTRVLAVLDSARGPLTVREIGDQLAGDATGIPLKARTIQASLKELEGAERAKIAEVDGRVQSWCAHRPVVEVGKWH